MESRELASVISSRLQEQSPLIQVVIGARQIGKTTALKGALNGKGVYETADSPTPMSSEVIETWWSQAAQNDYRILAIDEIQKINGWSEVIKKLWDTSPQKIKLVVTGSAALLVEKGLRETLAGRFELIRAQHWNFQEAQDVFTMSLEKFIEFGCYPGSVPFMNDLSRWGNYIRDAIVEPAIGRDLLQLHPVDQPALLRQIFGVAVSLPSQVVSLQKIHSQLQGRSTLPTIQNYLSLLSSAFLVTGLQKFSTSNFRLKKSSPKLIVHDNALIRAFEKPIDSNIDPKKKGFYFENQVGARFIEAGWSTFYWKERNAEVDFVVIGPDNQRWAIEVKSSTVSEKELDGVKLFCKRNPEFEPCLLSLTDQVFTDIKSLDPIKILSLK
jgi:uncharacterized protein